MSRRDDFPRASGGAALGARLRRLSERIDRESTALYATLGVRFEQRWYGVLDQIARNGPMTVTDLAAVLGVTHASVSQARRSLETEGLVCALAHAQDARSRLIALTETGRDLVETLAPLWDALRAAAAELDREAGGVVALLDRLDDALDARPLADRVHDRMNPSAR